jgi:DNA-binding transcriptional LysR family regulator
MRYPDLEISSLRAFVAVAETGSFTIAGDMVGRSQSAVSQKIFKLEDILERRVFDRSSRSISLTKDGEQLLAAARRILEMNDVTVRTLLVPSAVGSLRLGVSEDFVPGMLPKMLSRFRILYPNVRLELMTGLSCRLLEAYDSGSLDLVIAKKDGSAQRGRVIWRDQLVWMAGVDYEVEFHRPVPLVLLPAPCTYRELMIRMLDSTRQDWFPSCTAASLAGAQAAVAGGLGISVLGHSFLTSDIRLVSVPEHWPALPMTEIVILGEDTTDDDFVQPLLSVLTESLARLPSTAQASVAAAASVPTST